LEEKIIKQLFNIFICKIKNHVLIIAGACPFTGKNYNACTRCGAVIAI
jgi:hypothetical protein